MKIIIQMIMVEFSPIFMFSSTTTRNAPKGGAAQCGLNNFKIYCPLTYPQAKTLKIQ